MVWYDPRTWKKKEEPKPKTQDIFFGDPPKTPFALPGTYVTPEGKVSYGGGEAFRGGGGIGGVVGITPAPLYTSTLLQQSFASEVARATAESAYRQRQLAQQKIQQQLAQQRLVQQYTGQRRTTITPTTTTTPITVHPPGTIYDVQTGTWKVPGKAKYIPTTKTYAVGEDWTSREPTKQEREYFEEYKKAEAFKEIALQPTPSRVGFEISEAWGKYKDLASEELISQENLRSVLGTSKAGEFIGGAVYGTVGTKGALFRTGAVYVATAGLGAVVQGVTKGATYGATALWGARAGAITGTTLRVGTIGAGIYFGGKYVGETAQRIYEEPTYWGKGRITGRAGVDIGASIYGFRTGMKGYDIVEGLISTKRRTFIDVPQGIYPTAYSRQQLSLFRKNIYLDLGKKPGAFHVTGDIFWRGGRITPEVGTSELAGLYASTKISTPFARISGISSTAKFDMGRWIQSLLTPPGKPGVAFLQPDGFRYSYAKPGKWYWPAKKGYADVPGIKAEIEAIFRPEAGGYGISSKGAYTRISGVRVPIDSFVYDPSIISAMKTGGLVGGAVSYPGYTPFSYVNPTAGLSLVSPPSTSITSTTTTPSLVSVTPPYSSVASSMPSSSVVSSSKPVSSSRAVSKSYSSAMSSIAPSSLILSSLKPSSRTSISKIYSSIVPSSARKAYGYSYGYYYKKPPVIVPPYKFKGLKLPKQKPFGRYPVYGRRFGKFKVVGIGRTEREAFRLGKKFARETLGVTFKIPGVSGRKLPKYITKIRKGEVLYMEPIGKRLKKFTKEIPEIQFYRKVKGGRKKKK